jgi:CO dehydrogenase maturation factor
VFMSMKLEQAVVESTGYDLVVMGQPEGSGCYCAANTLLTAFLERLRGNYPYIVIDNEAGMEHISRLTTSNVDILLIVSDTSRRGLQAAVRINELTKALNVGVGKSYLVVNQVKNGLPEEALKIVKESNLELAGMIPEDDMVYEFDLKGQPTIEMPDGSSALTSAFKIFDEIIE